MQAHHVARLDFDLIRVDDAHQPFVAEDHAHASDMSMQVDHHAAALTAGFRHPLDSKRAGLRARARLGARAGLLDLRRPDDIHAVAKTVIEARLRPAMPSGLEERAD